MRTGQRQNPGERVAQCSGVAGGEEDVRGTGDEPEHLARWFIGQKELQRAAPGHSAEGSKSLPGETRHPEWAPWGSFPSLASKCLDRRSCSQCRKEGAGVIPGL